ncbi:MAG: hypothetical protein F4Y39_09340, partial [Gemmatimonadetes bacterium]|nr:hypothetical protein [Gemmatimonadota bacterium]MYK53065.1 hypothetical protein [Gemmatimonadota bacterium]
MKEIYSWVPWFRELGKKIAEGGETYLIEKANQMMWGSGKPRVLLYGDENIDPFSFFYSLAQKNTRYQREIVYNSVHNIFDISAPLDTSIDEYYVIPTPPPPALVLFHDGKNFDPNLLWRLFRQTVETVEDDPKIDLNDFNNVLKITNVGVAKLTQTLFLINPEYFLPMDDTTCQLSEALDLPVWSEIEKEIKDDGYEKYQSRLKEFKRAFPECQPYEINMFLDRQKSERITNSKIFQIDTII